MKLYSLSHRLFVNVYFMQWELMIMCEESLTHLGQNMYTQTQTQTYTHIFTTDPNHEASLCSYNPLCFVIFLSGVLRMTEQCEEGRLLHHSLREALNHWDCCITAWKKILFYSILSNKHCSYRDIMHKYAFSGMMPLEKQAPCWLEELLHQGSILRVPITIAGRT